MKRISTVVIGLVAVIAAASLASGRTPAAASGASARPANGQITFEDAVDVWNGQVFIMNPDGTARHRLPLPWATAPPTGPVWSPDGTRILVQAFANPASGAPPDRPATVSPDGSNLTVLDPDQGHIDGGCQAWSPDGTRLLCAGGSYPQPGRAGIFSIRASDGGDFKWLTAPPEGASDGVGDYSPDGTRFVFVRATSDDNGALFVENTDGTGLHQITAYGVPKADDFERMDWSPDGSEILFGGEHWSLYTIHPDGTGLKKIVQGQDGGPDVFYPTWSPDGTRIAYAYNSTGYSDIYTANADGTHRMDITNTPGEGEGWASWGTHPLAAKCTAAETAKRAKALAAYKRQMPAARQAYFRAHHNAKARAAFVKRQRAKLNALEQRVAACAPGGKREPS